jgi:choline kinase
MKRAVILCAGVGQRLAPMGWDLPKCLLPVAGRTILDHALAALSIRETRSVTLVVGHRRELVESEAHRQTGLALDSVYNPDYATTNTIYSLWLARHHLADGFLLLNGDVLFDGSILDRLLVQPSSSVAVAVARCGSEDVKVAVDGAGCVLRIGKQLPPEQCLGESVGLARFDRDFALELVEALEEFVVRRGERGLFFEAAVESTLARRSLRCCPIDDLRAIEIDTPEDYGAARRMWEATP